MPGRNKKRVNYKRLDSKGRSPPSTVEVEVDVDPDFSVDVDIDEIDGLAERASSLRLEPTPVRASTPALAELQDDSVTEDDIVSIQSQISNQENRLREGLLKNQLRQLRATFARNEAALERQAAEFRQSAPPATSASAPPIVRARAPLSRNNAVAPSAPVRQRQRQPARPNEGEFELDGFQADSENYILDLVNNDNKRVPSAPSVARNIEFVNDQIVNTDTVIHNNKFAGLTNGSVYTQGPAQPQVMGRASTDGAVRSGMGARSVDRVQTTQHWAHAALPVDFNTEANTSFADLDFRRLVAGEIEIVLEFQLSQTELEGRLKLLRTLAFLLGSYPWTAVRSVYAAVLRRIELGKMTWASDFSETMNFTLLTYANKNVATEARPEKQGRTYSSKRNGGPSQGASGGDSARVWYCPEYQRSTCAHNEPHQKEMYGKLVTVHHVCAKCLLRDRREAKHPDTSTACPHNRD